MARNLKPDYINRIRKTPVPAGYKFDIANYLYNPSYDCDYPAFLAVIAEDENTQTVRRIQYFKHYDGSGEYQEVIFSRPKTPGWAVTHQRSEKVLGTGSRFSLKTLISYI